MSNEQFSLVLVQFQVKKDCFAVTKLNCVITVVTLIYTIVYCMQLKIQPIYILYIWDFLYSYVLMHLTTFTNTAKELLQHNDSATGYEKVPQIISRIVISLRYSKQCNLGFLSSTIDDCFKKFSRYVLVVIKQAYRFYICLV